jgi:ferredoxin
MSARQNGAFEIYLSWSDVTLNVAPDKSALQVLLEAGLPIEPGCQTGGCGACATEYVEGDVVHKDACLSASDREHTFCPCVSRATSRIVLAF